MLKYCRSANRLGTLDWNIRNFLSEGTTEVLSISLKIKHNTQGQQYMEERHHLIKGHAEKFHIIINFGLTNI